MLGSSAGGTLAVSLVTTPSDVPPPDFLVVLYAHVMDSMHPLVVPKSAPPAFITLASDDQLGFAPENTEVYNAWIAAGR